MRTRDWHPAALVPAVLGLAASAYLTAEHYHHSAVLACPENATINCAKVTTSRWSHVGPVPMALAGLVYFVVMVALLTPPAWRAGSLDRLRVAGAVAGVVSVVYLVYVELFEVDAICLWCTAVHVCTVVMLGAVLWSVVGQADGDLGRDPPSL